MSKKKITVEIQGFYLSALETIAEEYNKQTLEMWEKGEKDILRKKEDAASIINHMILRFWQTEYTESFDKYFENILKKNKEFFEPGTDESVEETLERIDFITKSEEIRKTSV